MNYLHKFIPFKRTTFFLLKNSLFFILFFIMLSFYQSTQAANKTLNLVVGKYECTKNADCSEAEAYCDIDSHICRSHCDERKTYQCRNNSDCSGEEAFCDVDDHTCKQWPAKCHKEMCVLKEVCENVLEECDSNEHFVDGHCVECVSNADCTTSGKPFCNLSKFACNACPGNKPYWNAGLNMCTSCLTDAHCKASSKACRTSDYTCQDCYTTYQAAKPYWNSSTKKCEACPAAKPFLLNAECVACLSSADCPSSKPKCDTNHTCVACASGLKWNGSACVGCLSNADCPTGKLCVNNTCQTGCTNDSACSGETPICYKKLGMCIPNINLTEMNTASKNFILNLVSPNYGKKVQIGTSYTAPSAGYISAHSDRDDCYCDVYIDGLNIKIGAHFRGYHEYDSTIYPVAARSSVSWSGQGCTVYFIPCRGAN